MLPATRTFNRCCQTRIWCSKCSTPRICRYVHGWYTGWRWWLVTWCMVWQAMMQLQQAAQQLSNAGLLPPYVPCPARVVTFFLSSHCRLLQAIECGLDGRRRFRLGGNGCAHHDLECTLFSFFLTVLCTVVGGDGNSLMEMMGSGVRQTASAPPAERYGNTKHAHYGPTCFTEGLLVLDLVSRENTRIFYYGF